MSKTITISDSTWDKIKNQVQEETKDVKEKKKINITIKNRFTGAIIWESEKTTYKEAVEDANLEGVDLKGANLKGANLEGINLKYAKTEYCKINFSSSEYTQAKQFIEGLKL